MFAFYVESYGRLVPNMFFAINSVCLMMHDDETRKISKEINQ